MKQIINYFRNQLASFSDNISDLVVNLPNWISLILVGFILIIFVLPGQFNLPPLDRDEARFSQASKQMIEENNFITIKFQDELRAKKPIGIYWIQSFSAYLFGKDNIFSYRIPNILAAIIASILTGFFVYNTLTRFIGQSQQISFNLGVLSSIFLVSVLGVAIEIRQAKTDTVLLLICLCQQWLLWKIYHYGNSEWNIFKKI